MFLLSPRRFFILIMNETYFAEPITEEIEETQEPLDHEEDERFEPAPEYDTEPAPRGEAEKESKAETAEGEDAAAQRKAVVMERYSGNESDWKCTYQESGHRIDLETNQLIDGQGKSLTKEIENSNVNMSAEKIAEHHRMLDHFRANPDQPYPLPDWIEKTKDGDEIIHVTVAFATKGGSGDKFVDVSYETWSHKVEKLAAEDDDETEAPIQQEQMIEPDITIIDLGAVFTDTAGENVPVAEYGIDTGENIDAAITEETTATVPDSVAVIPASHKAIADNISVGAEETPDKIEDEVATAANEAVVEVAPKNEHLPAGTEPQGVGQPEATAIIEEGERTMAREKEVVAGAVSMAETIHEPVTADAAAATLAPERIAAPSDRHGEEISSGEIEIEKKAKPNETTATIAEDEKAPDGTTERDIVQAEVVAQKTTPAEPKNEAQDHNIEIKTVPAVEVKQARQIEVVTRDSVEETTATAPEEASPTAREIVSASETSPAPAIKIEIAERTPDIDEKVAQTQISDKEILDKTALREARHEHDAISANPETSLNESAQKKEHGDAAEPRPMTGRQILLRSLGIPLRYETSGESALPFGVPIASGISAQDVISQSAAPQRERANGSYLNGITLRRAA
jgi:hypothetical protein